jgi:hypothetical protein
MDLPSPIHLILKKRAMIKMTGIDRLLVQDQIMVPFRLMKKTCNDPKKMTRSLWRTTTQH